MAAEFVCSVIKENKLGFYRLHTIWHDDKLEVKIASKNAAWNGEVSKEKLSEMGSNINQPLEKYLADCQEALTTADGKPGVVYEVDDGSFIWKQIVDEDTGMKVRLGAIPLRPASFVDTIQDMMDVSLSSNKTLAEKVSNLSSQNIQKEGNINELFHKLETYQKEKDALEKDLYKRFLAILNCKKDKIIQLEEELSKRQVSPMKSKPKKSKNEEDPYNVDTDEDSEEGLCKRKRRQRKTTKKNNTDEESNGGPRKRKYRQRNSAKKAEEPLVDVSVDLMEEFPENNNDSDATASDEEFRKRISPIKRVPIAPEQSVNASNSRSTEEAPPSPVAPEKSQKTSSLSSVRTPSPVEPSETVKNASNACSTKVTPSLVSNLSGPFSSTSEKGPLPSKSKDLLDFFFGSAESP